MILKNLISKTIMAERYNNIIDFIINNTRLSYDNKKLTLDNADLVIEYIRAIEKDRYNTKFDELKSDLEF